MAMIVCPNCERTISNRTRFCPYCDYKLVQGGKGFAITGLIFSIISFALSIATFLYTFVISLFLERTTTYTSPFTVTTVHATLNSGIYYFIGILSILALFFAFFAILFGIIARICGYRAKMKTVALIFGFISLALLALSILIIIKGV